MNKISKTIIRILKDNQKIFVLVYYLSELLFLKKSKKKFIQFNIDCLFYK